MLDRLLFLLNSGKGNTLTEIARGLDSSALMVADMLQQLSRAGYLQEVKSSEVSACTETCSTFCGAQHGCHLGGGGRVWLLTEKGRRRASIAH